MEKIEEEDNYYKIHKSLYTTMHTNFKREKVLPNKYDIIKMKGDMN